jgi:hypothetical protein
MKLIIAFVLFNASSVWATRTFMQEAKEHSKILMKEIMSNPFLVELKRGNLPKDKFNIITDTVNRYPFYLQNRQHLKLATFFGVHHMTPCLNGKALSQMI